MSLHLMVSTVRLKCGLSLIAPAEEMLYSLEAAYRDDLRVVSCPVTCLTKVEYERPVQ